MSATNVATRALLQEPGLEEGIALRELQHVGVTPLPGTTAVNTFRLYDRSLPRCPVLRVTTRQQRALTRAAFDAILPRVIALGTTFGAISERATSAAFTHLVRSMFPAMRPYDVLLLAIPTTDISGQLPAGSESGDLVLCYFTSPVGVWEPLNDVNISIPLAFAVEQRSLHYWDDVAEYADVEYSASFAVVQFTSDDQTIRDAIRGTATEAALTAALAQPRSHLDVSVQLAGITYTIRIEIDGATVQEAMMLINVYTQDQLVFDVTSYWNTPLTPAERLNTLFFIVVP